VDVAVDQGVVASGSSVDVDIDWYLSRNPWCENQLGISESYWLCVGGEESTAEAIPDNYWRFEFPEIHAGPEGLFYHTFEFRNTEPGGGTSFWVDDLKFIATKTLVVEDLESGINWGVIPSHPFGGQPQTLYPGNSLSFNNIYSDILPGHGYIYFKLVVLDGMGGNPLLTVWGRHPITYYAREVIPTLSTWGSVTMGLLLLAAMAVAIRRGKMSETRARA
jgi:hypothetical protein